MPPRSWLAIRNGKPSQEERAASSNLHAAWDTWLVLKAVGEDAGEAATELMKTFTPAKIESWSRSAPMNWANESFAIAEGRRRDTVVDRARPVTSPRGR